MHDAIRRDRSDPFELSIFCNLAQAIAEEACSVLARTAYTTFIKESEDFSVALATPAGTFFAFPGRSGVPVAVGLPMETVIEAIADWRPGDILLVNDPYTSGGMVTHSPDVTLIGPVFFEDELVAFCWSFLHSSDVGGAVPGSLAASLTEVFQEGLRIPPTKLYRAGELNADLHNLILTNVRAPHQLWGDIQAMVSAFHVASGRLIELFGRYGLPRSKELVEECLDYGEAKARAVIAKIPCGTYEFVDYLDDDINSSHPVRICLSINKSGSNIHLDFTGTDPQVMAAINLATAGKKSHTWLTSGLLQFLLTADRDMPINGGILRPISVTAPSGTIVNAISPASLGGRLVTGIRVMDAIFGALLQALPNQVPCAGSGQGLLSILSTPSLADGGRKVHVLQPLVGGTGARPTSDGYDGTNYSLSFMKNTPIEIIEAEMDVIIHRYHYVTDSGGPGEFRGGLGVGLRAEAITHDTTVALRGMERMRFAPWGAAGGQCGGLTRPVIVNPGRANEKHLAKNMDVIRLGRGDMLEFMTSGGGGFGDPIRRDPTKVVSEVRNGFVSRGQAEQVYGIVFEDDSVTLDLAATIANRDRISRARPAEQANITFCGARREYERTWGREAYEELGNILVGLPIHARTYAKTAIMDEIAAKSSGAPAMLSRTQIRDAWMAGKQRLGLKSSEQQERLHEP